MKSWRVVHRGIESWKAGIEDAISIVQSKRVPSIRNASYLVALDEIESAQRALLQNNGPLTSTCDTVESLGQ